VREALQPRLPAVFESREEYDTEWREEQRAHEYEARWLLEVCTSPVCRPLDGPLDYMRRQKMVDRSLVKDGQNIRAMLAIAAAARGLHSGYSASVSATLSRGSRGASLTAAGEIFLGLVSPALDQFLPH
jgi:hypothetical protein